MRRVWRWVSVGVVDRREASDVAAQTVQARLVASVAQFLNVYFTLDRGW